MNPTAVLDNPFKNYVDLHKHTTPTHTYTHIHTHKHKQAHSHTLTQENMHTDIYAKTHLYIYRLKHLTHMQTHSSTNTHAHSTPTPMHTHTYTQECNLLANITYRNRQAHTKRADKQIHKQTQTNVSISTLYNYTINTQTNRQNVPSFNTVQVISLDRRRLYTHTNTHPQKHTYTQGRKVFWEFGNLEEMLAT